MHHTTPQFWKRFENLDKDTQKKHILSDAISRSLHYQCSLLQKGWPLMALSVI